MTANKAAANANNKKQQAAAPVPPPEKKATGAYFTEAGGPSGSMLSSDVNPNLTRARFLGY